MQVTIGLKFCRGDASSTSTNATFTWTADLPAITSATFTNCRTAIIRWAASVEPIHDGCNLTKYFPNNNDSLRLTSAKCIWRRKVLKINLNQAALRANEVLEFDNEVLKALGATYTRRTSATTTVNITAPANRAAPQVILSPKANTVIGKCSKFRVSYYTPVRAGMTAVWSVAGSDNDTIKHTLCLTGLGIKAEYGFKNRRKEKNQDIP
jgi:hypothetical protein